MIGPDGINVGNVAFEQKKIFNKFYMCELGICDQKKTILWDDIKDLRIGGIKASVNFIPVSNATDISITDFNYRSIRVTITAGFAPLAGNKIRTVNSIMEFIISKIFDRQWNWLIGEIRSGRTVSFNTFEVNSHALSHKKILGGHVVIELDRVSGYTLDRGWLYVSYLNDKGKRKSKWLGRVSNTANLHLATSFLNFVTRQNQPS